MLTCSIGDPPPPPPPPPAPTHPAYPGPVSQASSLILITTTLHAFTFLILLYRSPAPPHYNTRPPSPGVDVPRSHRHGEAITGTAGGPCTPPRPAHRYPCCPCPHSSPPNQCLSTDTSRPLYQIPHSIGAAAEQSPGKKEAPRRQVTPLHLRFVLGEKPPHDTDAPCSPKKAVEERKPYLSTQRCPRVEVVGYPQHPQHGKA